MATLCPMHTWACGPRQHIAFLSRAACLFACLCKSFPVGQTLHLRRVSWLRT